MDLPSVPEALEKTGHRLKSENSFACSFDSYNDSLGPESSKEDSAKMCKSRGKGETPVNVKASLADRYANISPHTQQDSVCLPSCK